jgi:NADH dehydrogenase
MTTLVLGGAGFLGRHIAAALAARGHAVAIGSRWPRRAARRLPPALHRCERREVHLERLTAPEAWRLVLTGIDTVVNAVGILRERGGETYERVHHLAPGALAAACARRAIRLIHISALGLHDGARSRFLRSKLAGERAVAACGSNYSIVRPSLVDGEGGFGARWFRRIARWPVHFLPADAVGRIAALDVCDLGEAVAALCEPAWGGLALIAGEHGRSQALREVEKATGHQAFSGDQPRHFQPRKSIPRRCRPALPRRR